MLDDKRKVTLLLLIIILISFIIIPSYADNVRTSWVIQPKNVILADSTLMRINELNDTILTEYNGTPRLCIEIIKEIPVVSLMQYARSDFDKKCSGNNENILFVYCIKNKEAIFICGDGLGYEIKNKINEIDLSPIVKKMKDEQYDAGLITLTKEVKEVLKWSDLNPEKEKLENRKEFFASLKHAIIVCLYIIIIIITTLGTILTIIIQFPNKIVLFKRNILLQLLMLKYKKHIEATYTWKDRNRFKAQLNSGMLVMSSNKEIKTNFCQMIYNCYLMEQRENLHRMYINGSIPDNNLYIKIHTALNNDNNFITFRNKHKFKRLNDILRDYKGEMPYDTYSKVLRTERFNRSRHTESQKRKVAI